MPYSGAYLNNDWFSSGDNNLSCKFYIFGDPSGLGGFISLDNDRFSSSDLCDFRDNSGPRDFDSFCSLCFFDEFICRFDDFICGFFCS